MTVNKSEENDDPTKLLRQSNNLVTTGISLTQQVIWAHTQHFLKTRNTFFLSENISPSTSDKIIHVKNSSYFKNHLHSVSGGQSFNLLLLHYTHICIIHTCKNIYVYLQSGGGDYLSLCLSHMCLPTSPTTNCMFGIATLMQDKKY